MVAKIWWCFWNISCLHFGERMRKTSCVEDARSETVPGALICTGIHSVGLLCVLKCILCKQVAFFRCPWIRQATFLTCTVMWHKVYHVWGLLEEDVHCKGMFKPGSSTRRRAQRSFHLLGVGHCLSFPTICTRGELIKSSMAIISNFPVQATNYLAVIWMQLLFPNLRHFPSRFHSCCGCILLLFLSAISRFAWVYRETRLSKVWWGK